MNRPALLVAVVLLVAACEPGEFSKRPPDEFARQGSAVVVFVDTDAIDTTCRRMGAAAERNIQGCTSLTTGVVYMPRPCTWSDAYAQLLCHETGHVAGWRHD